jgi:predicted transcriptional regulator
VSTQSSSSTNLPAPPKHTPERLQWLKDRYGPRSGISWRERPIKLKYKNAIVRQYIYDLTNKEIAKELGVAPTTFSQYRNTKDGKELLKECENFRGDNRAIIEARMHDEGHHSWENIIESRDRMYDAGQYESAAKIDMEILKNIGVFDKAKNLNLNIQGSSIRISLDREVKSLDDLLTSPADTAIQEAEYKLIESDDTNGK